MKQLMDCAIARGSDALEGKFHRRIGVDSLVLCKNF